MLQLLLQLAHKVVVVAELLIKGLLTALPECLPLLLKILLNLMELFFNDLVEKNIIRIGIVVVADIWVRGVPWKHGIWSLLHVNVF